MNAASKEGNEVGISNLQDEKIGWVICKAYAENPGSKYCCCVDQKDCFFTKALCMQFCTNTRRVRGE